MLKLAAFQEALAKRVLPCEGLWDSPKALLASLALKATGRSILIITGGMREDRLFTISPTSLLIMSSSSPPGKHSREKRSPQAPILSGSVSRRSMRSFRGRHPPSSSVPSPLSSKKSSRKKGSHHFLHDVEKRDRKFPLNVARTFD